MPSLTDDLSHWLNYLANIHVSAIDMGLERVLPVFHALNIVPKATVFMVAGTNGKGSTTATISEICVQAGLKTALYQSPHLVSFNERIKIDNVEVCDDKLIAAFDRVERVRQSLNISLSFFEMTTLAAFLVFFEADCDVWVLEVGLGGRLDVVNIIEPDVCVITNIAIDHVDWLGDTIDKIGYEKAGIIRPNKPIVFGEAIMPHSVQKVIEDRQARLIQYQRDYVYVDNADADNVCEDNVYKSNEDDWIYSSYAHTLKLARPSLAIHNVAIAISAIIASNLPIKSCYIINAMQQVRLAGRLDMRVIENRQWLFDVAHNTAGVHFLLPMLHKKWQAFHQQHPSARLLMVFGMLADKDTEGVIDAFKQSNLPLNDWYVTTLDNVRTLQATVLAGQVKQKFGQAVIQNFEVTHQAIEAVMTDSTPEDFIVVVGSFHTIGESLLALKQYDGFKPI